MICRFALLSLFCLAAGCREAPDETPVVVIASHTAAAPDSTRDEPEHLTVDVRPDTAAAPALKSAPDVPAPGATTDTPAAPATGGVYILVVGIDDYPGNEDDLESTHADVALIRTVLAERFAVPPSHVRTLLDRRATRAAIIAGFREHLARAGPTGTAIFYYSGHGLRLADNAGFPDDEGDGRDEAIYVWGAGERGAVVLDDEIGLLADDLGARRTLLILDSCFSGTGARGQILSKVVDEADAVLGAPPAWLTAGRTRPTGERFALLAASSDAETALAGLPGEPSLFTSVLAPALRSAPADASFADVIRAVRPRVMRTARGYGQVQTPQAEGLAETMLRDLVP